MLYFACRIFNVVGTSNAKAFKDLKKRHDLLLVLLSVRGVVSVVLGCAIVLCAHTADSTPLSPASTANIVHVRIAEPRLPSDWKTTPYLANRPPQVQLILHLL